MIPFNRIWPATRRCSQTVSLADSFELVKILSIFLLPAFMAISSLGADFLCDLSLLRKWDQGFYDRHPYQPFPRVLKFRNGEHQLVYVATKHKNWKDSHRLIKKALEETKPDIVLLEGLLKDWGESPSNWNDKIQGNLDSEGLEDYFAFKLTKEMKIPSVGSEPGRMASFSSFERDQAAVTLIAELLKRYRKVIVIYGAGHFVQQERTLEKLMGKSVLIE
jgi:hypothetical protein